MTEIIRLSQELDPRDAIHRVVEVLARGDLAILPTETGYVVSCLANDATSLKNLQSFAAKMQEQLQHGELQTDKSDLGEQVNGVKTRPASGHFCLMLGNKKEAEDYWGPLSGIPKKLATRGWPGPIYFALPHLLRHVKTSLISQLPAEIDEFWKNDQKLMIGVSHHEIWQLLRRLVTAPFISYWCLSESDETGELIPLLDYRPFLGMLDEQNGIIIDDGESRFQQAPTLIDIQTGVQEARFHKGELSGLRTVSLGVISETSIKRMVGEFILFVCTGNTCRSPMAEGMFRQILATELDCRTDELIDRGYIIASAGLAAQEGCPATPEAVKYLRETSIDISMHTSKTVTHELLEQADRIYTMTKGHRLSILSQRPDLTNKIKLLSPAGRDVADPIGGDSEVYAECAREIEDALKPIIRELLTPTEE
jgi:protein-tyrosine phosphatase